MDKEINSKRFIVIFLCLRCGSIQHHAMLETFYLSITYPQALDYIVNVSVANTIFLKNTIIV